MKKIVTAAVIWILATAGGAFADHSGRITYEIDLNTPKGAGTARLWMPYPLSNEFQTIKDVQIDGNHHTSGIYRDPGSEAIFLTAGWESPMDRPHLTLSFQVNLKERGARELKSSQNPVPAPIERYLAATPFVPADDPQIVDIAREATAGRQGILEKAQGVYDWVVANTFRDPEVKGCGFGIPALTLNQAKGGGKCADISTVFVTIARAAGVPARDVYGLRLADPQSGDITSGFHCWAEFYLPGNGWIPVDPADVRKMMLVHKIELENAGDWRKFFWGGDDLFRVVLAKNAREVMLEPAQKGDPLNYFMYPYAEIDGQALDYFDPKGFTYSVSYQAN